MNLIILKLMFCSSKDTLIKWKGNSQSMKNHCKTSIQHLFKERLVYRKCKYPYKLVRQIQTNRKMAKDLNTLYERKYLNCQTHMNLKLMKMQKWSGRAWKYLALPSNSSVSISKLS